jgi:hypothetical protein
LLAPLYGSDWNAQPSGTFTSRLSTERSPSPLLDITTTATGLLCWRGLSPAGMAASLAARSNATEPFGAGADQCLLFPASDQIAVRSRMTLRAINGSRLKSLDWRALGRAVSRRIAGATYRQIPCDYVSAGLSSIGPSVRVLARQIHAPLRSRHVWNVTYSSGITKMPTALAAIIPAKTGVPTSCRLIWAAPRAMTSG